MRFLLSVLWLLLIAGAGPARAQETAPVAVEADIVTAPVAVDGVELFRVRGLSSYPPETRAGVIRERIETVAADRSRSIDSIRAVDDEQRTLILGGDLGIMTVTEADARLERVRPSELATTHLIRIRQAVISYRAARSAPALRRAGVNALVATLLLAISIFGLVLVGRRVERILTDRVRSRIPSVEIKHFEVMNAERIWSALRRGVVAVRFAVLLAVALVYLGFVLAQFPWTRPLSRNLATLALAPLLVMGRGIVAHLPSLVFLTVLFLVVRVALKLVRLFFDSVGRGTVVLERFDAEWADPTYKIVRLATVAFALVVAYPYIPGSGTAAFQGVSLFIGIIFSLGSSAAISNIIAGYMMTYRRALKVGDRVKIGDTTGDVIDTRLQVTHLRSYKNEEIIIPNALLLAGEVLNYSSLSRTHGLILHTEVGIGYDTPWRQVEAMLLTAAGRTEGLLAEPPPFVLAKRLGDFAVTYEVNAYCNNAQQMARLYSALHRNILDVFNENGVQIMTPAYEGDPEQPKLVERGDWYRAPAVPGQSALSVPR
jgi:small-conductance mechanosensitive channel